MLVMPSGATQPVKQDIGGWMVMPKSHFDALMDELEAKSVRSGVEEK